MVRRPTTARAEGGVLSQKLSACSQWLTFFWQPFEVLDSPTKPAGTPSQSHAPVCHLHPHGQSVRCFGHTPNGSYFRATSPGQLQGTCVCCFQRPARRLHATEGRAVQTATTIPPVFCALRRFDPGTAWTGRAGTPRHEEQSPRL